MPKRHNGGTRKRRASSSLGRRARRHGVPAALAFALSAGGYGAFVAGYVHDIQERVSGLADLTVTAAGLVVRDVTVTGRHYTLPDEILDALETGRGQSILSFDPAVARERIVALRWVRDASISRLFPDTIHVAIEEHRPFAVWHKDGRATLIDDRGAVVSGLDAANFPQLPIVVGPGAAEAAPEFLALLDARPSIGARVRAAVRVGERRWTLKLDNGIDVLLPEDAAEAALDELIIINERTGLLWRDIESIDLRLADRVVVLPHIADGQDAGRDGSNARDATDRNT